MKQNGRYSAHDSETRKAHSNKINADVYVE